jgi:hypothetical protein
MAEPTEFSPAWFDASSAAWLANKRKLGNCTYRYTCDHQYSTWRRCGRDVYKTESMCRQHFTLNQNAKFKAAMTGTNAAKKTPESPKYD